MLSRRRNGATGSTRRLPVPQLPTVCGRTPASHRAAERKDQAVTRYVCQRRRLIGGELTATMRGRGSANPCSAHHRPAPANADYIRALVARCQAGDRTAFEPLLAAYRPLIQVLVRSMSQDDEWIEDSVVEVEVQLCRSMRSFAWRSSFTTWVYSLTIQVCAAELRRDARHWAPERLARYSEAVGGDPTALAVQHDQQECALRVVADLPEKYRVAVVLRHLCGYTYREVADILGVPLGTAKTRVLRGTAQVARALLVAEADPSEG